MTAFEHTAVLHFEGKTQTKKHKSKQQPGPGSPMHYARVTPIKINGMLPE